MEIENIVICIGLQLRHFFKGKHTYLWPVTYTLKSGFSFFNCTTWFMIQSNFGTPLSLSLKRASGEIQRLKFKSVKEEIVALKLPKANKKKSCNLL